MSTVQHAAKQPESHGQPVSDSEPADGRAARSHRSRRAIVDAMRALHAEGDLRPTAPRVAERAGVSLRTVWQQFADMETLLVEANRRDDEILRSLMKQIDPDQPLAARVAHVHRPAGADPGADDPELAGGSHLRAVLAELDAQQGADAGDGQGGP